MSFRSNLNARTIKINSRASFTVAYIATTGSRSSRYIYTIKLYFKTNNKKQPLIKIGSRTGSIGAVLEYLQEGINAIDTCDPTCEAHKERKTRYFRLFNSAYNYMLLQKTIS